MAITIKTYGIVRKICGDNLVVQAETPEEAIQAMSGMFPELKKYRPSVKIKECPNLSDIKNKMGDCTITLIPFLFGGKSAGVAQIVVGLVLLAVGLWIPGPWTPYCYNIGFAMIIGGVVQMLSAVPKMDVSSGVDSEESKYLGAPKNTTKIGTRIPYGYGRYQIGGQILSFKTDSTVIVSPTKVTGSLSGSLNTLSSGTTTVIYLPSVQGADVISASGHPVFSNIPIITTNVDTTNKTTLESPDGNPLSYQISYYEQVIKASQFVFTIDVFLRRELYIRGSASGADVIQKSERIRVSKAVSWTAQGVRI